MKSRMLAVLLSLCACLSSCGVIFGGSKFTGTIIAKDHPNANIYVNGSKVGQGRATGLYPRNQPLHVELRQDGCETKTQTYYQTFRTGNFILSVISWGLVGIVVDLATGASYKPDHRSNPEVQRMDDKNFLFNIDYSGCPNK